MLVRRFIACVGLIAGVCSPRCQAVGIQEEGRQISVTYSSSTNPWGRTLATTVDTIRSNHRASGKDCSHLRDAISELGGTRLVSALPGERQEIVRGILGPDNYSLVEEVLSAQLKSADRDLRDSAIRTLGRGLFSASSQAALKDFVFGSDRGDQFFALTALVALGTPGASDLLTLMLLSGTLSDYMAADAIGVLLLSDTPLLSDNGPEIISANKGPIATRALLPALKQRTDFKEIVTALFRSDIGRAPDEERLTLMDRAKIGLEFALLDEISQNYTAYSQDSVVKQKVEQYAKSSAHSQLYVVALIALERSGESVAYFEEMLKDGTIPKEKVQTLNLIIDRIRAGQRLLQSGAGPASQTTNGVASNPLP